MGEQMVTLSAFTALNERYSDALVRIQQAESRERELVEAYRDLLTASPADQHEALIEYLNSSVDGKRSIDAAIALLANQDRTPEAGGEDGQAAFFRAFEWYKQRVKDLEAAIADEDASIDSLRGPLDAPYGEFAKDACWRATPDREAAVEALRDYWQRPGVPSAIRKDYPDFANLLEAALAATTPEGDNGR